MEETRINPSIAYDIVELPSRGIHYANGKKSIRVSYLTAADEDILSAQNLVRTNKIIDELIKRKVLDKDLKVEELVEEDIEAILIFLRNTAWGSDYKVVLKDPKPIENSDKYIDDDSTFEHMIDLSTLKMKDFKLEPDENGEYKYHCEKSNVDITFKFLSKIQEKQIDEMKKTWDGNGVPPEKTKELEMMIKSVQGIRDPMQIRSFIVDKMPIKDSQDFRKYVAVNKPGLDLSQTIIAPSGEKINTVIGFGVEFFRPFYGL